MSHYSIHGADPCKSKDAAITQRSAFLSKEEASKLIPQDASCEVCAKSISSDYTGHIYTKSKGWFHIKCCAEVFPQIEWDWQSEDFDMLPTPTEKGVDTNDLF